MSGYENKRVLIVGLGESGKAAARFFAARGARVSATDARAADELRETVEVLRGLGVTLELGGHPAALFASQDLIVPSPGVPWDLPLLQSARKEGLSVAGELEAASRELEGRVVGVTGTNGKTTTTALLGHIFECAGFTVQVGGNIGTPVLSLVESSTPATWNVLELSSFQLEAMRTFRCHVAAVLNVTPDHLDRHGDMRTYVAAKANILAPQQKEDSAVLNYDDPICRDFATQARGRTVWFSRTTTLNAGAWVADGWIVQDGRRIAGVDLPIRGPHNLENALAATAAASAAGVPDQAIAEGLSSFRPVEHRLELVRTLDGVAYYNDSKATNVDAAIKAVESFEQGLWLILGGRDKGSDYTALLEPMRGRVKRVLLIGEAAGLIAEQLAGRVDLEQAGDLEAAVRRARAEAEPGDTVLLAPACASFDQFSSYGHRGREFKRFVEELG